ncbi:hypothetical protein NB705_003836 [Xanthomonas sacchari]|nr:hypothetical protein [Xanthomonas sacchari]
MQAPAAPAVEHARVDIGLAAHRRGVAERLGHLADHRILRLRQRALAAGVGQRQRGQPLQRGAGAAPGAEVLGGEALAHRLAQVVVDLARIHRLQLAVVVAILEQCLPGQLLAAADQLDQVHVVDLDVVLLAALAAELQPRPAALDEGQVAVAQRGQAVGAVAACVFGIAHAHQGLGHQRHHHRQHLVARVAGQRHVATQAPAQPRQGLAEGDDALELAVAAHLRPVDVVAVLLAPARVAAGGLQVAVVARADPHFGVGRRDRQLADALQGGRIAHRAAVRQTVAEPLAGAAADDARLLVADIDQARAAGGLAGLAGTRRLGRGGRTGRVGHRTSGSRNRGPRRRFHEHRLSAVPRLGRVSDCRLRHIGPPLRKYCSPCGRDVNRDA